MYHQNHKRINDIVQISKKRMTIRSAHNYMKLLERGGIRTFQIAKFFYEQILTLPMFQQSSLTINNQAKEMFILLFFSCFSFCPTLWAPHSDSNGMNSSIYGSKEECSQRPYFQKYVKKEKQAGVELGQTQLKLGQQIYGIELICKNTTDQFDCYQTLITLPNPVSSTTRYPCLAHQKLPRAILN